MRFKQNQPLPEFREIVFHLTNANNGQPLPSQSFSGGDIQIRKPGTGGPGGYVNANATQQTNVIYLGDGDYVYTLTQAELDTAGTGFAFKVAKAGALLWTLNETIDQAFFFKTITGTLTNSSMTTDRTETTNDFWNNVLVRALDGANKGQIKRVALVGGYTGSNKLFMLETGMSFTSVPVNGDNFQIINE